MDRLQLLEQEMEKQEAIITKRLASFDIGKRNSEYIRSLLEDMASD